MQSVVKKILFLLWWKTGVLCGKLIYLKHEIFFRFSYTGIRCKLIFAGGGNAYPMPVSRRYALGTIIIGKKTVFGYRPAGFHGEILLQPRESSAVIKIGNYCHFSNSVSIVCCRSIEIGDNFLCGDRVSIVDCDFHGIAPDRKLRESNFAPVKIGNNVWLGSEVMVLKGVTIGNNAVIGAKSLVTKDIPANCVAVGNPAKVIRMI